MSSDRRTLVILTPGFPKDEADSTCLPMQQSFIRLLKEMESQLNIIVLSFHYPYHKKKYTCFDISVIPFGGRNKGGLARLLLRKNIYTRLTEIRSENKIIGLLSFWYNECALVGKRFGDKHGIKHYCWILGQDAKKENKYPKKITPKSDELIALSGFIQDEFEKNHGVRPKYVIPPGIDPAQFNNDSKKKDIDILAAGSLIPLKQYDIFIEVIAEIKKTIPNIRTVLIGDGPEKEELQKLISKFELHTNITLTGEVPHFEVLRWMQRTKLFLHPSSYEGFGVVCLEALYSGAHVISFCQPTKQNIEHWHIVRTKEEMKQKVLAILECPDTNYYPVLAFAMSDCVKEFVGLFDHNS